MTEFIILYKRQTDVKQTFKSRTFQSTFFSGIKKNVNDEMMEIVAKIEPTWRISFSISN